MASLTPTSSSSSSSSSASSSSSSSSERMSDLVGRSLQQGDKSRLTFQNVYTTDARLRSGSFGTVYTCHPLHNRSQKQQQQTFAVKILDRQKLKKKDDAAVFREVAILKELGHLQHVVRLIDFFQDSKHLYMVQVYAPGGDVFDRLTQLTHYTEKDARDLARILLSTIQQIHALGIVHRDLKPENLLLQNSHDESSILVADFGFARHVPPKGYCHTRCGTPAFVAPEVVLGVPYQTKVDLWSVGCLLYMLLGGYPPFSTSAAGNNHRAMFRKIRAGDYVFHEKYFQNVSVSAKQLISNLLTVNVDKRWTAQQALQSAPWFTQQSAAQLSTRDLSGSLVELKKTTRQFQPRQTWRSAAMAVRWASSAPFWTSDKVSFGQQMALWDKSVLEETTTTSVVVVSNQQDIKSNTIKEQVRIAQSTPHSLLNKIPLISFSNVYDLKTKLRTGAYATVWECCHKTTDETYAVKMIQRQGLQPKDDEAVLNEVAIMQSLVDNKYVVHLMDFYETEDHFYLVLEYMNGGDVFDRIINMTHYSEYDARNLVMVLLKAVASLHKVGIAHRDIKPQNLLLRSKDNHADIKLADFGFSRRVHTPMSLTTRVGTPTYVAPEILKNIPHDERVDLWSIGVVIFVLLVGYPPFFEEDQAKLFDRIRRGDWEFHEEDWKHISHEAKDLVEGLLVVDPKDRWSIEEALRCPWINLHASRLSTTSLSDSLRVLKAKKYRLRTLAKAFMFVSAGRRDSKNKVGVVKQVEVVTQAQETVVKSLEKLQINKST